ncbi:MAG: hypothetical protein F6K65_28430 [Moorea sp. SIO3C2]|nr:hypothetical protein [Moorena sp. SIO3C2]
MATIPSKFAVDEAIAEEAYAAIDSLSHLNLQGIHIFTESNVLAIQLRSLSVGFNQSLTNVALHNYPTNVVDQDRTTKSINLGK